MSIPRVGSSKISTFGAIISHLASTTFCWLPPDKLTTAWLIDGVFVFRRCTPLSATLRSVLRLSQPNRE